MASAIIHFIIRCIRIFPSYMRPRNCLVASENVVYTCSFLQPTRGPLTLAIRTCRSLSTQRLHIIEYLPLLFCRKLLGKSWHLAFALRNNVQHLSVIFLRQGSCGDWRYGDL